MSDDKDKPVSNVIVTSRRTMRHDGDDNLIREMDKKYPEIKSGFTIVQRKVIYRAMILKTPEKNLVLKFRPKLKDEDYDI